MINYGNHFIDKSDISFVVKAMRSKKLKGGKLKKSIKHGKNKKNKKNNTKRNRRK